MISIYQILLFFDVLLQLYEDIYKGLAYIKYYYFFMTLSFCLRLFSNVYSHGLLYEVVRIVDNICFAISSDFPNLHYYFSYTYLIMF